jgi:lipopolysaccharide transport system ATP-binding protein
LDASPIGFNPDLIEGIAALSDTIITVEKLSKSYLIGHQSARVESYTLRDVIGRKARKAADLIRGRQIVQGDEIEEFWALKNVTFELKQGEIVGIVGRNGAGKSTLLKILSRITEPTEGRILLRGRVASLLEVGTGFHAELTGRENIFLNGAILGMTRREIYRKFDAIVAFAEVEKFLDTPVKRYSSGMYVRLAFAVAAHLEPEILVVDEVLAVGDAAFQKKCLGKMNEVSRKEGRTVIVVSHNMGLLTSLCPFAIWLDHGSIRQQGTTKEVIAGYLIHGAQSLNRLVKLDGLPRKYVDNDERLRLESIEWLCELPLRHREGVKARIRFKTQSPLADVIVVLGFSNLEGSRLLSYQSDYQDGVGASLSQPGSYSVDIEVDSLPLAPAIAHLDIGCYSGASYGLDFVPAAVQLEIVAGPATPGNLFESAGGVRGTSKWVWNHQ